MRETPVMPALRTDLIRIKSMAEASFSYGLEMSEPLHSFEQWLPISIAPEDCDLQVGAMDKSGVRAWTFPCRKRSALWFNAWANRTGSDLSDALARVAFVKLRSPANSQAATAEATPKRVPSIWCSRLASSTL